MTIDTMSSQMTLDTMSSQNN